MPVVDDSGPILPTTVEKVVLKNGVEVLLENPRIRPFIGGTVIGGYQVDGETGKTTDTQRMIAIEDVERHVAMGWRNTDSTLHEMKIPPRSMSA